MDGLKVCMVEHKVHVLDLILSYGWIVMTEPNLYMAKLIKVGLSWLVIRLTCLSIRFTCLILVHAKVGLSWLGTRFTWPSLRFMCLT
jgi:hypothetical protein